MEGRQECVAMAQLTKQVKLNAQWKLRGDLSQQDDITGIAGGKRACYDGPSIGTSGEAEYPSFPGCDVAKTKITARTARTAQNCPSNLRRCLVERPQSLPHVRRQGVYLFDPRPARCQDPRIFDLN